MLVYSGTDYMYISYEINFYLLRTIRKRKTCFFYDIFIGKRDQNASHWHKSCLKYEQKGQHSESHCVGDTVKESGSI